MVKEIISKRGYLKQLKKRLRFKYNKDDVDSILNDYNEIFDIELAQGKTENDICILLGDPEVIVQNLSQEVQPKDALGRNILSKRNRVQSILIAIIFFLIAYLIYRVNDDSGRILIREILIIFPIIASLLWIALMKSNFTSPNTIIKKTLLQIKISHIICFLTTVFLFYFFNYGIHHLKNEYAGIFVVRSLYLLIAFLCGLIVLNIFWFKGNEFVSYSVICHALGVIAIILYDISILYSLTTLSLYSLIIKQSAFIYLETIIIMFIFIVLSYKGDAKKWMHN